MAAAAAALALPPLVSILLTSVALDRVCVCERITSRVVLRERGGGQKSIGVDAQTSAAAASVRTGHCGGVRARAIL